MQTATLNINGLTSEQAARILGKALETIEGIDEAKISLLRSQVDLQFDETRIDLPRLSQALANAGFPNSTADARLAGQGSCCGGCCS